MWKDKWEGQLLSSMDLVPTLSTESLIQLWSQLQVGGWEKSTGGDFRADWEAEALGLHT